jgi:hypothetical protein
MENDVSFVLGGIAVNATAVEANGASYNGKKICIALPIPEAATWAKRMQPNKKGRLLLRQRVTEEKGLSLDMSVSNNLLFWKNGPCSISHVIWEQFRNLNL